MAIFTAEMMREAWRQHCVRAGMAGKGRSKVRGDSDYYAKLARRRARLAKAKAAQS